MHIPNSSPSPARQRSSIRWLIASLVGAFAFVSYVQRMNISIAAELMMPDLSLSKTQMGQVFSSFLVGYALCQVAAGKLGDTVGPRITLSVAAMLWGCVTVLTGLIPGGLVHGAAAVLLSLIVLRFLLGASEAATFPVGSRAIRAWTPPEERALGNAFMMAGSSSAAAVTGPLVSWLMLRVGWRTSFFVTALLAFVLAIVWFFQATDNPGDHPRISVSEVQRITADSPSTTQDKRSIPVMTLVTDRNILMLSLSYVCEGYVLFIFVFWLYIYLVEVRSFSILGGGLVASLPWLAALACSPLGGLVCDRIASTKGRMAGARAVIMFGYLLSGALLFVAARVDSRSATVAALCISVGALYFAEPAFWATAIHLAGENAGAASGIMNTAGILGGIASTSLTPVLVKHFGWLAALSSGALVAIACTGIWWGIGRQQGFHAGS